MATERERRMAEWIVDLYERERDPNGLFTDLPEIDRMAIGTARLVLTEPAAFDPPSAFDLWFDLWWRKHPNKHIASTRQVALDAWNAATEVEREGVANIDRTTTAPDQRPSLHPCPFCGLNDRLVCGSSEIELPGAGPDLSVSCLRCNAAGPVRHTQDEAARAWNSRA